MHNIFKCFLPILCLLFLTHTASAEEFQCEVMSLEGNAFVTNAQSSHQALKEGDILNANDVIEVAENSSVDLAYDKDWQNVARLEENSKVEIKSIFPTALNLSQGGIYAKLKSLPKQSTFEVQTPTAIAAVRGTEYRTVVSEEEGTQVFNFSDSQVFVFGQDESGKVSETPMVVENAQVTQVPRPGVQPMAPRKMSPSDFQKGGDFRQRIEKKIQDNVSRGRTGKMPDMRNIEKMHEAKMGQMRQGRGALVSKEASEQKTEGSKLMMDRENKLLQAMDNAKGARPQGQGSDGNFNGNRNIPGVRGPEGRVAQGEARGQKIGQTPEGLKKNDEAPQQNLDPNNQKPGSRRPQPGKNSPAPRPPR